MTNDAPPQPGPQPPQVQVEVSFACGTVPTPEGGQEVVIGFMIGGKFQSTLTITPAAADQIADEIKKAAKVASSPIATPPNNLFVPGR